ncbi:MAG TPA: hypothetical protein PK360_17205 [bacterium]|nr:hypothetical protein [bacterium]
MSVPINPDINLKSETGELPVPGSEQYTQILLIQLILAEKRTSLSLMRTAIAIFSLPLSVATVLIATSRWYSFFEIYELLIPVLVVCAGLLASGIYIFVRAIIRIRKQEALIEKIKKEDPLLSQFYI